MFAAIRIKIFAFIRKNFYAFIRIKFNAYIRKNFYVFIRIKCFAYERKTFYAFIRSSASVGDLESTLHAPESLYEPPGSEPSAGYVSPGWTEDSDLDWSPASPSLAVTSGDSDPE